MRTFRTLTEFYNSQEWKEFRKRLIFERTSACGGVLKDEITGQPIYKSYDIIAHHVAELTASNVNDVSISLNPDNIKLISHRTHNAEHARFGYTARKKVYFVFGAPCSGKSTYVDSVKGNSDLVVDIDLLWQALTGGQKYFKPNSLRANIFALYGELLEEVKIRKGTWQRAYIVSGAPYKADRERRIEMLGAEPIYIEATRDECMERLYADEERREVMDEWEGYIADWFEKYQE